GCGIYEVRPTQCRTYPFWPDIMRAPETWQREAQQCPGIGQDTLVDAETVDEQLEIDIKGRRRNSVE
ncbi:MAG: YkgJ family cysteine cluster protein, partial [Planctomycetes bacterium]|nr:YkgJ family cysteine cluster protein [Planctomycetota bacterium]